MSSVKACKRKRRYLKGQAISIAVTRSLYNGRAPGSAYECEHCGWWHVTKQPRIREQVWQKIKSN